MKAPPVRSVATTASLEQRVAQLEQIVAELRAALDPRVDDPADGGLFRSLADVFGADAMLVADVMAVSESDDRLRTALEGADITNETDLGMWLRRMNGRVCAGLRLERGARRGGGRLWRFIVVVEC